MRAFSFSIPILCKERYLSVNMATCKYGYILALVSVYYLAKPLIKRLPLTKSHASSNRTYSSLEQNMILVRVIELQEVTFDF